MHKQSLPFQLAVPAEPVELVVAVAAAVVASWFSVAERCSGPVSKR